MDCRIGAGGSPDCDQQQNGPILRFSPGAPSSTSCSLYLPQSSHVLDEFYSGHSRVGRLQAHRPPAISPRREAWISAEPDLGTDKRSGALHERTLSPAAALIAGPTGSLRKDQPTELSRWRTSQPLVLPRLAARLEFGSCVWHAARKITGPDHYSIDSPTVFATDSWYHHPLRSDLRSFRSIFELPAQCPVYIDTLSVDVWVHLSRFPGSKLKHRREPTPQSTLGQSEVT